MPLIHRVTHDMFQFSDVCDYMVNPVNTVGVAGAGLALEFKNRVPSFFEDYRAACKSKELRVGTLHVQEDTGFNWGIINFPTKRYYADTSNKEDIVRGLEALRELLKSEKYRYATIAMPMLGCGCGKQDYEVVYPLMIEHLSDLDATIFLSMSPEKTELKPKYLALCGPRIFPKDPEKVASVEAAVAKVMDAWGMNLNDYTGIISGGNPGFDTFFGGSEFGKNYEDSFIFRKTGEKPLVIKPNLPRNSVGATIIQGKTICEIADDIILFKPKGLNNNALSLMQGWLLNDRQKRYDENKDPRRIAISGDQDMTPKKDEILVQDQDMDNNYNG